MVRSFWRFLEALSRRAYFWIGAVLFVFPIVAHFVPLGMMSEMAKVWSPENDIWLTFVGALLLLWTAFRVWQEQVQLSVKLLRALWADLREDGQPASSLSPDALRNEVAENERHAG
jgi:hypothetical protein